MHFEVPNKQALLELPFLKILKKTNISEAKKVLDNSF